MNLVPFQFQRVSVPLLGVAEKMEKECLGVLEDMGVEKLEKEHLEVFVYKVAGILECLVVLEYMEAGK